MSSLRSLALTVFQTPTSGNLFHMQILMLQTRPENQKLEVRPCNCILTCPPREPRCAGFKKHTPSRLPTAPIVLAFCQTGELFRPLCREGLKSAQAVSQGILLHSALKCYLFRPHFGGLSPQCPFLTFENSFLDQEFLCSVGSRL